MWCHNVRKIHLAVCPVSKNVTQLPEFTCAQKFVWIGNLGGREMNRRLCVFILNTTIDKK